MAGRVGRARNETIDRSVLSVAARHLAQHGYEAMSLTAIADEAGTTRQALYRRWPSKVDLAAAVVAQLSDTAEATTSADPFGDLVDELSDFQRGVSKPGRLSLAGTMLQETTDAQVLERYRTRVVAPRRGRLRGILETAVRLGLLDAEADLEVAVTMCTGCWYGRALSGAAPPPRWPQRTAALVWRALGGTPPPDIRTGQ